MHTIESLVASETHDSRGMPTVMVTMRGGGHEVTAKVPSGKSAGTREACELRDADNRGVTNALQSVNGLIAPAIVGHVIDPIAIDNDILTLDGTPNKTKLGANALLAVSMATARLKAVCDGVPLWKYLGDRSGRVPTIPALYMNMMNGGAHANFCLPFQEYIVVVGARGAEGSYALAKDIFARLGKLIKEKYGDVPMGDEGGYAPKIRDLKTPFEFLREVTGGESGVFLAIDAAASEFYLDGRYVIASAPYSSEELLNVYKDLTKEFYLKSIEDPFDEKDFSAFEKITHELGERILIVGDDLTVTNPGIVSEMIAGKRANAMIIKPNQVGTVTEVLETVARAYKAGWKLVASHRSGETDDAFVADLAVGIGAYGLKAGAPTQPERRAKYERLMEIEKEMRA